MVALTVEKSADRNYVFIGISNKVKYSVIITNTGTTKANCVRIKDNLSLGARYIPGTFTINGTSQNIKSIANYISVGSIRPGSNILVSYDVEVIQCYTPAQIENQAVVTYCDDNGNILEAVSQNLIIPTIQIDVITTKSVDKTTARIGEVLSYSVFIRNNSNIGIDNIVFYDALDPSLELLPDSVLINLSPQYIGSFNGGIALGSLNAYTSIILNFQVLVIALPNADAVTNASRLEFSYTINDAGIAITSVGATCSNTVSTTIINDPITC